MKRRLQNRQAQRRFRQRKEERQQTLEQKIASLEIKYQELLEEFNKKSEEASQTRREKEALSTEIDDLRKRWRLMVLLLSRPNGLQSLTMLLGNERSQPLSGTSTMSTSPMLSNFVDCLQPLLSPKEAPQIAAK
jgi:TolA-binding protein